MSDSGVVDPIRLPPWLRQAVDRTWGEWPVLARAFLILAILDVLGRAFGVLAPRIDLASPDPLAFLGSVLPHDLWILLPALIVARRPDAMTATPQILGGAMLIAVVELVSTPLEHLFGYGSTAGGTIAASLSIVESGLTIAAWVLLARGLAALNPRGPSPSVAGLSNLVAAGIGASLALQLLQLVAGPSADLGDAALDQLVTLMSVIATLRLVGWAYLMWIVVRGLGDTRRPAEATILAAVGAMLSALFGVLWDVVLTVEVVSQQPGLLTPGTLASDVANVAFWLSTLLGPTLVAGSFALGLAEPPIPLLGAAPPPDSQPAPDVTFPNIERGP